MTVKIIVIAVLIALSAYFSGTEMAYTSVSEAHITEKYEKKKKLSLRLAQFFLSHYDNMLATILIGNNVVNLTASSLATVVVVDMLGNGYSWVATVVMTLLILNFGEILPKIIGKQKSEAISEFSSIPLRILSIIFFPAVYAVNFIVGKISVIWRKFRDGDDDISADELPSVVDIAEKEGVLDEDESELVKRAVRYKELRVYEIITPRVDIEYMDVGDSWDDIIDAAMKSSHSRIPVCDGDPDNIVGVLHLNRLFFALADGKIPDDIHELLTEPIFIPKTAELHSAVEIMKNNNQQMVFVVDSYGGVMGIVTMEDALEELVGDIWDESDDVAPDYIELGGGSYDLGAKLRLGELFENLELDSDYDEITDKYTTVGGLCADRLGLSPSVGASFDIESLHFTVKTVDGTKPERFILSVRNTNDTD